MNIETIHLSLVNGQRRQMVEQIDEYGSDYDFWSDYAEYLDNAYLDLKAIHGYFKEAVVSYNRIKNR